MSSLEKHELMETKLTAIDLSVEKLIAERLSYTNHGLNHMVINELYID